MKKVGVIAASVMILALLVGGAFVIRRSATGCEARHDDEARQAIAAAQPDEIVLHWQQGEPLGGSSTEVIVYGDLSAFSADTDSTGKLVWHSTPMDPSAAERVICCLIEDGMADVPTSIPPRVQASDLGGASFAAKIGPGPARQSGLPDDVQSDAPDPHADERNVARTLSARFKALHDSVVATGKAGDPRARVFITRIDPVGAGITWTGPRWPTAVQLPARALNTPPGPIDPPEVMELTAEQSASFTNEGGRWPTPTQRAISADRLVSVGWRPIL